MTTPTSNHSIFMGQMLFLTRTSNVKALAATHGKVIATESKMVVWWMLQSRCFRSGVDGTF